jgi:hypothetical protein
LLGLSGLATDEAISWSGSSFATAVATASHVNGGPVEVRRDVAFWPNETMLYSEPIDPHLDAGSAPGSPEPTAQRPGTRYLEDRRRLLASRRELPEVASLRRELAPLVRAERVVRHRGTALLATVYDLVPRPRLDDYRRLVAARAAAEPGRMLALTGPWPPYAFAPGLDPELGEVAAPAGGAAMEAR